MVGKVRRRCRRRTSQPANLVVVTGKTNCRQTDPALREAFDERAAILEFDAGYKRLLAEQMAFSEVQASTAAMNRP